MAVLRVESVVRGYHRYKDVWLPQIGDSFDLTIEEDNRHDRYAVATMVNEEIVGHVPREFSRIVYYFIQRVTGRRKRSITDMKGLEIPCIYEFSSQKKKIVKMKKLLRQIANDTNVEMQIL